MNGNGSGANGGLAVSMRDVTKVYQMGEVEVHALRGVSVDLEVGGFLVLLGPSGSGQVHPAEHPGRARCPDLGAGALPGAGPDARRRRGADPVPAATGGVRVPVLQPHPVAYRPRERGARDRDLRGPAPRTGGPRHRRAQGPEQPLPLADVRRRAAAGGHRPRHRQAARHPALRRTHRSARHHHRQSRCSKRWSG